MKAFKKIALGLLAVCVVVIGALIVVPFFYSIDQFRPQIQAAVEKQVRGKVELGKLTLKLFPAAIVQVDGVKVTPSAAPFNKEPLATIGLFSVRMPLSSFLTGPQATIVVEKPSILLIQQGEKSNLTALLPEPPAQAAADAAATPPQEAAGSQSLDETLKALPPWLSSRVRAARMHFKVVDGTAVVRNLAAPKGDKTEVHALNVAVTDIGLGAPMGLDVSLTPDVVMGDMKVTGPMKTTGKITANPEGKGFRVAMDIDEDMTGLDARMSDLFHKRAGIPFSAGLKGTVVQGDVIDAKMDEIEFRFGGFKMKGALEAKNAQDPAKGSVKLSIKSGETTIAPFGTIVPMIADFKMDGKFNMAVDAAGPMLDPTIDLSIAAADVTGSTPQLKHPVTGLTGKIRVQGTSKNPLVTIDPFSMKIASSDMTVKVTTKGLDVINAQVLVGSNRLNLDELLGLEALKVDPLAKKKPGEAPAPAPKAANSGGAGAPPPAAPLDATLNELAPTVEESLKNPMLDKLTASVKVNFKSVQALGAEFTNGTFDLQYAKRTVTIARTGIGGYGGRVDFSGSLALQDPKAMGFDFKAGLANVNVGKMMETHAPNWKDALTGMMNGSFAISGRGLRTAQLEQNLAGGLSGDVKDGKLTLPVVKLVDAVMSSIPQGLGKKAEAEAKGKEHHGEFKTMKLVTAIKGRKIDIQDIDVQYDTAGVGAMRFKASGVATFDQQVEITGTAFMSPEVVRVAELRGPSGQIEIPMKMKGPMAEPKPDIGYSMGILGPRIAQNALKGRATAEVKKVAEKLAPELQKVEAKAPEPVKKGIEDLKKKFKF